MTSITELLNSLGAVIDSIDAAADYAIGYILRGVAVFLLSIVSYFYVFLKFFKVLCYSKLTFEWFPMINPYVWPFSIFNTLTGPYFAFWSRVLPTIKLEKSSVEISNIIALEALNTVVFFLMLLTQELIGFLTFAHMKWITAGVDPASEISEDVRSALEILDQVKEHLTK